jgi:hypothetical protein
MAVGSAWRSKGSKGGRQEGVNRKKVEMEKSQFEPLLNEKEELK